MSDRRAPPRIRDLAAAALALACISCSPGSADPAPGDAAPREGPLSVRRGPHQTRFLLTGEVRSTRAERILVPRTPVWNLPIRWLADDGALVRAGERVVELDPAPFTGEIEQRRLALDRADSELARKRAELEAQREEKEFTLESRRVALAKAQLEATVPAALLPARVHDERQLAAERAESEWLKAREDLAAAEAAGLAQLEDLRVALDRTRLDITTAERAIDELRLAAPRDGILVIGDYAREGRKLQVGDQVSVGNVLATIPDLSRIEIVARLSDVDDGRIHPGQPAECVLDTYPELTFEAHVAEISPIAQEESPRDQRRSFRVVLPLAHSDEERMRPGMSARCEVLGPRIEDALLVPRAALRFAEDADGVRARLADGSWIDVEVRECSPRECRIESGLDDGQLLGRAG